MNKIISRRLCSVSVPAVAQKHPSAAILSRLVCPLSKGTLVYSPNTREVISLEAHVAFPVLPDGTINLIPMKGRVLAAEALDGIHRETNK